MSKVVVIGIGPGNWENMTLKAVKALEESDLIVGYTVYVDLIKPHFPNKEYYQTPMLGEAKRCQYAIDKALEGKSVAVVCSGDSGIYGMTALIYELRGESSMPEIEVVSGLTAASSGSALLGAPLTHDFAVISLSDLLTEWSDIERRLDRAAESDMSIVIYNPSSKKRKDYLKKACDIILRHSGANRVCGICSQIGREGEFSKMMTLGELREYSADMFTTVFIGNSKTKVIAGKMVTPRGYREVMTDNQNIVADLKDTMLENLYPYPQTGLSDDMFIRVMGEKVVPMTKSEIRSISLSKLMLTEDAVVYDIGAGSGSVTIEMAGIARKGRVYAIECKEDAVALIGNNIEKFGLSNITVVSGMAPKVCSDLESPTHAFIGGTSGNMISIIKMLLSKNPNVRIVLNVVTLESISEAILAIKELDLKAEVISVNISRSKKLGSYNLLAAQNPVMIITLEK